MSSGDCRWLADSVLKNRTSKERLCVVLCSDNDVLVPVVVQKQQGRNPPRGLGSRKSQQPRHRG